MERKEVFISYAHEDKERVEEIVTCLEKQGVSCWIAPRDVGARRYAKAICEAIENAKIFLLMLSSHSAVSEHVLNEIEMAYNKRKNSQGNLTIETICLDKIDLDSPSFDEIMYYIRRINFIQVENDPTPEYFANQFIDANKSILRIISNTKQARDDFQSEYVSDEYEYSRLKKQNDLLKQFDLALYQKELIRRTKPVILDVGSGDGSLIVDRVDSTINEYEIIALDCESQNIEHGKEIFKDKNIHFEQVDLSEDNLSEKLEAILKKYNIDKFDIINLSMIMLHITNKVNVLRALRRVLKNDGTIIIKDIDDGINFAYPDEGGKFQKAWELLSLDVTAGLRESGRRIYPILHRAGFKNISLENVYLTTIGMAYDEKEIFFEMYFKMILDGMRYSLSKYPTNWELKEAKEFMETNIHDLYEEFMKEDFVFALGFMLYRANK